MESLFQWSSVVNIFYHVLKLTDMLIMSISGGLLMGRHGDMTS